MNGPVPRRSLSRLFLLPLAGLMVGALALAGCSESPTDAAARSAAGGGAVSAQDTGSKGAEGQAPQEAKQGEQKAGGQKVPAQTDRPRVEVRTRSIVRTADLNVRTKDVRGAAGRATSLAQGAEGYVANQQSTTDGSDRAEEVSGVSLVLRVPVEEFDRVVRELRRLGTVYADKQEAVDVTDEVVDVESRLSSQRKSIERLRSLLSQADTVGEVMQVESELATREADLEALQARSATLGAQAALSTIRVSFEVPTAAVVEAAGERGFLAGLGAGWNAFTAVGMGLLTALGAMAPFLVLLALLGVPAWWIYRARTRRRHAPAAGPAPEA
ncbi:DUF4349 domain-containing protein [Actinopolymorpha pittospori]